MLQWHREQHLGPSLEGKDYINGVKSQGEPAGDKSRGTQWDLVLQCMSNWPALVLVNSYFSHRDAGSLVIALWG